MRRIIPTIFLVLAVGCGGGGGTPEGTKPDSAPTNVPEWSLLSEGTLHSYGNLTNDYLVTREETAWNFLHRWVTGAPPDPGIDFETHLALSALSSKKPTGGHSITVTNVTWSGSMATVHVNVTSPSPGQMVPMMITSPYALASLTAPAGFVLVQHENGAAVMGLERTYEYLVNKHFETISNPQSVPASAGLVADLEAGLCPNDATTLAPADLYNTNLAGTTTAHYCPKGGKYWVRHLVTGASPRWYGDYAPGF